MLNPAINIANQAITAAGKTILRSLDRIDRVNLHKNQQENWITDVEIQAVEMLYQALVRTYPKYGFLSEVFSQEAENSPYTWVIDGLCSTENYLRGLMHCALSAALCKNGIVEAAVIYDPIKQELFHAAKGEGAFLNNRRLRVSTCNNLEKAMVSSFQKTYSPELTLLSKKLPCLRASGSLTLDLAYLAAGRVDALQAAGTLYAWEALPGSLLVQEAGGFINIAPPFSLEEPFTSTLCATTPTIYKPFCALFSEKNTL